LNCHFAGGGAICGKHLLHVATEEPETAIISLHLMIDFKSACDVISANAYGLYLKQLKTIIVMTVLDGLCTV
jgi:hypothetical protein